MPLVPKKLKLESGKTHQTRKNLKSRMDVKQISENGRRIHNFLGVFELRNLNSIRLLKDDICLIVIRNNHAIGIYVSPGTFEIYDPLGLQVLKESEKLCEFIFANALSRKLLVSSQIQSPESENCAKIVLVLLLLRANQNSFEEITEKFRGTLDEKDSLATNLFQKLF